MPSRCVVPIRRIEIASMLGFVVALALGCADANGTSEPAPTTSAIDVSLSVTGADAPSGFAVVVDGRVTRSVDANTRVTIDIAPGAHTVHLNVVADNCSAPGGTERALSVATGRRTTAAFTVSCTARIGSLRVTTVTTGEDPDSDGYAVAIGGGPGRRIGMSASTTYADLRTGEYTLALGDVAPNCIVVPPTPFPVRVLVLFGVTTEVTFEIQCAATGALRVTSAMSGPDPDPDGFTARAARDTLPPWDVVVTTGLAPGGEAAFARLATGSYRVTLAGLAENCDVTGTATRHVQVSARATTDVAFAVACAPAARLAFVSDRDGDPEIYTVAANGTGLVRLTHSAGYDGTPTWSPDGRRIAFVSARDGNQRIYVMNGDGSDVRRLTAGASDYDPAWSPDGRRIAFAGVRNGNAGLLVMDADGTHVVPLTSDDAVTDYAPAWSPDGARIAFTRASGATDVYVMSAAGANLTKLTSSLTRGGTRSFAAPAWSPDGTRLAVVRAECTGYCSYYDVPATVSVLVMHADGSGAVPLVVQEGGTAVPRLAWSPDGRAIAFAYSDCASPIARSVLYVRADGAGAAGTRACDADVIVRDGYDPAWRP